MYVKDVMTTKVVKVSPENSVRQAAKLMLGNNVSGLPVVDDEGRIVGIISEGDLIRRTEIVSSVVFADEETSASTRANSYVRRNSWRVGDVMTVDLVTVAEEALLSQVATLMHERAIKRVPVVKGGKLIGIVSRADLLQAILWARPDNSASGDSAIQRSIIRRFNENTGLEGLDLGVTVIDGIVHLSGKVESAECRRAARVIAEGVRGVRGVVEHFAAPNS